MDGNINVASRQRLVDAFNSDERDFGMLMNTKTGECLLRGTAKVPSLNLLDIGCQLAPDYCI